MELLKPAILLLKKNRLLLNSRFYHFSPNARLSLTAQMFMGAGTIMYGGRHRARQKTAVNIIDFSALQKLENFEEPENCKF